MLKIVPDQSAPRGTVYAETTCLCFKQTIHLPVQIINLNIPLKLSTQRVKKSFYDTHILHGIFLNAEIDMFNFD